MRNEWTTIRIQHKVTGSMMNRKLAVGIPIVEETSKGEKIKTTANKWIRLVCSQAA